MKGWGRDLHPLDDPRMHAAWAACRAADAEVNGRNGAEQEGVTDQRTRGGGSVPADAENRRVGGVTPSSWVQRQQQPITLIPAGGS